MNLLILTTKIYTPTYTKKLLNQVDYLTRKCEVFVEVQNDLSLIELEEKIITKKFDCVFPTTVFEYDNTNQMIQGFNTRLFQILKYHNQLYIGSDPFTHMLMNDKALSSQKSGLSLPNKIITKTLWNEKRSLAEKQIEKFAHWPLIVKPNTLAASLGITDDSVVFTQIDTFNQITRIFEEFPHLSEVLIEPYIENGNEYTVSVTGNNNNTIASVTALTSYSGSHKLYSFKQKGLVSDKRTVQYSAIVDSSLKIKLKKIAIDLAKQLGLKDFSRFDFMVNPEGEIFLIDGNSLPSLGSNYLLEYVSKGICEEHQILGLVLAAFAKRTHLSLPERLLASMPRELLTKLY